MFDPPPVISACNAKWQKSAVSSASDFQLEVGLNGCFSAHGTSQCADILMIFWILEVWKSFSRNFTRAYPNGTGPGGAVKNYYFSGNLLTPEFWSEIEKRDRVAAAAGAHGGVKLMNRARARTL